MERRGLINPFGLCGNEPFNGKRDIGVLDRNRQESMRRREIFVVCWRAPPSRVMAKKPAYRTPGDEQRLFKKDRDGSKTPAPADLSNGSFFVWLRW